MQSRHVPYILGMCALLIAGEAGYIAYKNRDMLGARADQMANKIADMYVAAADYVPDGAMIGDLWNAAVQDARDSVSNAYQTATQSVRDKKDDLKAQARTAFDSIPYPEFPAVMPEVNKITYRLRQEGEKAANDSTPLYLDDFSQLQPAAGDSAPPPIPAQSNEEIQVEAVLVPQKVTVISSSRDGRIKSIHVDNGDTFKAGDLLIEYDCDDLTAETDIVAAEKNLADKKTEGTEKLFKLDLISDLEKIDTETKTRQVDARIRLYQARMKQCHIYAGFSGRVTNRLANDNEYTRTDRVLMEIASSEPLRAEFLIPSKWLRWVNVGAPLDITLNETERQYSAHVTRIYGEVDPVSQSIQVVATMDGYADPLLPGMSGQAVISTQRIRDAGIAGYLDSPAKP